jgi:hypothetical protein
MYADANAIEEISLDTVPFCQLSPVYARVCKRDQSLVKVNKPIISFKALPRQRRIIVEDSYFLILAGIILYK